MPSASGPVKNNTAAGSKAQKIMRVPMCPKTHRTAVVALPPEAVWEPIQALRRKYDRQFFRWMPHINLLYPFLPPAGFPTALPLLAEACTEVRPFEVTLTTVRYFLHPSQRATLWLEPEPREPFIALENSLLAAFPAYNDLCRFAGGFTPHLSLRQASTPAVLQRLLQELQALWQPCQFVLTAVALIQREADRPFRLAHWIPLAKS